MITNKNGAIFLFVFSVFFSTSFAKLYQADPATSTLSYTLVHPMHVVEGVSKVFECTVDLSDDTVSSKINVSAAISSFDTHNSSRDSHAMEIVEALKFPKVIFRSTKVKPEKNRYRVEGELTFHGKTNAISFLVKPVFTSNQVEILGQFSILLSDYNLPRPSLLFIPTEDKLTIAFDLFSKVHE